MIAWDIETGAQDNEILEQLYDPSTVKYGNTKDPAKRAKIDEEHKAAFFEKAALDPLTGQVLAIGLFDGLLKSRAGNGDLDDREELIIKEFFDLIIREPHAMIGFNTSRFDLPFVVRRAWLLNIDVPPTIRNGRYWSDQFIDLLELWQCGDRSDFVSQDTLAKAMGISGKPLGPDGEPLDGSKFQYLWNTQRKLAIEYLDADLETIWLMAERIAL